MSGIVQVQQTMRVTDPANGFQGVHQHSFNVAQQFVGGGSPGFVDLPGQDTPIAVPGLDLVGYTWFHNLNEPDPNSPLLGSIIIGPQANGVMVPIIRLRAGTSACFELYPAQYRAIGPGPLAMVVYNG